MSSDIEQIGKWISEYYNGYEKYMLKYHKKLYNLFYQNIFPPQNIGAGIGIGKSAKNTDKDHAEILKVTKEFCLKYPNPSDFPKEF